MPLNAKPAELYLELLDGCPAVLERIESGELARPSEATAEADRREAAELLGTEDDVWAVSLSACDGVPVVSIGVSSGVSVPAVLSRGTAVIAYYQPPVHAF